MSYGLRKCDGCHRDSYTVPSTGERKPLEVCFAHGPKLWLCRRCYFEQQDQEETRA